VTHGRCRTAIADSLAAFGGGAERAAFRDMHAPTMLVLAGLVLLPASLTVPPQSTNAMTVEIADDDATEAIGVTDVYRRGDSVVGTLVNRGNDVVRDIRLLIDLPFLWANEFRPGEDNPGRATVMTVAGPLEPGGRLDFEFTPNPPLPVRADGRYTDPRVRVMGYLFVAAR
jgi:hypothetical protein